MTATPTDPIPNDVLYSLAFGSRTTNALRLYLLMRGEAPLGDWFRLSRNQMMIRGGMLGVSKTALTHLLEILYTNQVVEKHPELVGVFRVLR